MASNQDLIRREIWSLVAIWGRVGRPGRVARAPDQLRVAAWDPGPEAAVEGNWTQQRQEVIHAFPASNAAVPINMRQNADGIVPMDSQPEEAVMRSIACAGVVILGCALFAPTVNYASSQPGPSGSVGKPGGEMGGPSGKGGTPQGQEQHQETGQGKGNPSEPGSGKITQNPPGTNPQGKNKPTPPSDK